MNDEEDSKKRKLDLLALGFLVLVATLLLVGVGLALRTWVAERAAGPVRLPIEARATPSVLIDTLKQQLAGGVERVARILSDARSPQAPPVASQAQRAPAGASGATKALPATSADPKLAYPVIGVPEGHQVPVMPPQGRWTYDVYFGPGWQKNGQLLYSTHRLPEKSGGKLGANMSWFAGGGQASNWFLGVLEADHPSHANTRFPGFFMHPLYLPQSLVPGSRVLWEFPWQGAGKGQVRRFDMRVVNWENVTVPAGAFSAMHLEGRLQYVDNETIKAEVRYSLWYAPQAKQVVRVLWLGRSPDEGAAEMMAELATYAGP